MVIKLNDIIPHVPITANLDDALIDPHIINVTKFKLLPKLGQTLINALNAARLSSEDWTEWDATVAYVLATPDIVIHNDQIWECLANNTGSEPIAGNTDWELKELYSFWYANIKPYMAYLSVAKYLPYAGNNFSQHGITTTFGTTFQPASGTDKGAMIRDLQSMADAEENTMYKKLADVQWTFDTITYTKPTDQVSRAASKNFNITAIG